MKAKTLLLIKSYEDQIKSLTAKITAAMIQRRNLKTKKLNEQQNNKSGESYTPLILEQSQIVTTLTAEKKIYEIFVNDLRKLTTPKNKHYNIINGLTPETRRLISETIRLHKHYAMLSKIGPQFEAEARALNNAAALTELKNYVLLTSFGSVSVSHTYKETKRKISYKLAVYNDQQKADLSLLKSILKNG